MSDTSAAGAVFKAIRFATCAGAGLHAALNCRLSVSRGKEKLYEDDKDDKDLVLLRCVPSEAELWLSTESGAVFFYETLKANLTDIRPDIGTHVTVTF